MAVWSINNGGKFQKWNSDLNRKNRQRFSNPGGLTAVCTAYCFSCIGRLLRVKNRYWWTISGYSGRTIRSGSGFTSLPTITTTTITQNQPTTTDYRNQNPKSTHLPLVAIIISTKISPQYCNPPQLIKFNPQPQNKTKQNNSHQ